MRTTEAIMAWKEILVKKYVVRLSDNEREQLAALIRKGSSPAHRLLKARILLKADVSEAGEGWSDNQIINALATSASMVYRVRKHLVEEGFEAVLSRKPRATPSVPRIFDGEGQQRVRGGHGRRAGRVHATADPGIPLVCLDETSKQLIAETRAPIRMKEGRPARFDYEYERNGTANLFMMFAPLEGWRHVQVTDTHTAVDYAHALKDLADIHFLNAKKIVLVQDNLNTHTKAALYEAFPAAEARRLVERFEWHYTPKHGS